MKKISTPENINDMFNGINKLSGIHYLRVECCDEDNSLSYALFEIGYNLSDDSLTFKSLSSEYTGDMLGSIDYDHTLTLAENLEDLKDLLKESVREDWNGSSIIVINKDRRY